MEERSGEIFSSKEQAIKWEVVISGAKNAVLPLMAAAILAEDKCIIRDVPDLRDVEVMKEILASLGSEIKEIEESVLEIRTEKLSAMRRILIWSAR